MSKLQQIPVTRALMADYGLLKQLVGCAGIDWIVIRTNPACEMRALESLRAAGLIAWLPMVSETRKHGRSKTISDASRPLCTRYLFVGLDRMGGKDSNLARVCDGVEKILSFHLDSRPHIVPKAQMAVIVDQVRKAQTNRKYEELQGFDIGSKFMLLTDAFKGFEATVTAYDAAKGMVTGTALMLGQEVPVVAPVDKIRAVGR
ncbi:transcription termination/antitermination NusG family protein [Roseibium algae]|uniref:Transcription termination/antitermination NusG family protein n=1 Tax=Roseibium algae TaxID=3123038 RepID=A0ABU8TJX6_9HYPH